MNQSALNTTGNKSSNNRLALIVDKQGFVGGELIKKFETENISTVLISSLNSQQSKALEENLKSNKVRLIIYPKNRERVPAIPDLNYSLIYIICYGEKEILEVLPDFIKKAEGTKGKIFLILLYNIYDYQWTKKISSLYKNAYTIFLGDLFDPNISLKIPSSINYFLLDAVKTGRIEITNMGMMKTYPVFLEDAIEKIKEVSLKNTLSSRVYFLFQKHSPTQLSLAHLFHKVDPIIKIDSIFKKNKELEQKDTDFLEGEYLLDKNYPLKDRIKQTLEQLLINESSKSNPAKPNETKLIRDDSFSKINNKSKSSLIIFSLYFLTLIVFLPIFITLIFSVLGIQQLKVAKNSIEKGNFGQAKNSSSLAKSFFSLSNGAVKTIIYEASIIGKKDEIAKFADLLNKIEEGSSAIFYLSQSLENFMKFFVNDNSGSKEEFNFAANSLKDAITVFQKFKAEGIYDQEFYFLKTPILQEESIDNSIQFAASMIGVLPNIFGFDREHRYLLLFQNNMELRPGGGFIGSYGVLTLNKGKIVNFSIHDVYDADGQLKGHIEPPFAIRRYLAQVHWYLRDSNFDIDFTKNASNAALFLNEEMGEKVDGVIGVDVSFVKEILNALGPIYVSDYKETVTADNLYILTQSHAEKNFFAGSSQKKDFLRSLFNSIDLKIRSKKDLAYSKLLEAVINSIIEKHLLFAFADSTVQSLFTANNMSSSLWDNRGENTNTLNDFFGANEANLGVNKANFFIKRKIKQEVKIDEKGSVLEKVTLTYKNTNLNGIWPGGDYKNYLRVVLPFGTEITSITIDGVNQQTVPAVTSPITYESKKFFPPKELEIEKTFESGKVIYGFLIIVSTGALKTIEISYNLPQKILLDLPVFSYSLKILKQPGTDSDPLIFSLNYPNGFKVVTSGNFLDKKNKLENKENEAVFSGDLKSDLNLFINFAKK